MTATILRHTLLFLLLASLFVAVGCSAEDSTTASNVDGGEVTPLHRVAKRGDAEALADLIKAGADVNARDKSGNTPLHFATTNGHVSAIETLLRYGADVNAQGKNYFTPLHFAVAMCHIPAMNVLIQSGANVNAGAPDAIPPLYVATGLDYAAAVNNLIDAGANVNEKFKDNYTPLHVAAIFAGSSVMSALINAKADVAAQDKNGYTALHAAATDGYSSAVDILISAGADVNAETKKQYTPLHIAARNGHLQMVDALINAGANVNASPEYTIKKAVETANLHHFISAFKASNKGPTPARVAELRGHKVVVSAIKEAGGGGTRGASKPTPWEKEALEKARADAREIEVGQTISDDKVIPFSDPRHPDNGGTPPEGYFIEVSSEYYEKQLKFFKSLNFPFDVPSNEYYKSLDERGCD